MKALAALAAGLVFGIGLLVSGMTDANKVIAFLDLFGGWDPSLALVMVGAIGVHAALRPLVLRRDAPVFDHQFHLPTSKFVDPRLLVGAALFGVGWALGGFCPGPGIVSAFSGSAEVFVFLGTMVVGMWGWHLLQRGALRYGRGHEQLQ